MAIVPDQRRAMVREEGAPLLTSATSILPCRCPPASPPPLVWPKPSPAPSRAQAAETDPLVARCQSRDPSRPATGKMASSLCSSRAGVCGEQQGRCIRRRLQGPGPGSSGHAWTIPACMPQLRRPWLWKSRCAAATPHTQVRSWLGLPSPFPAAGVFGNAAVRAAPRPAVARPRLVIRWVAVAHATPPPGESCGGCAAATCTQGHGADTGAEGCHTGPTRARQLYDSIIQLNWAATGGRRPGPPAAWRGAGHGAGAPARGQPGPPAAGATRRADRVAAAPALRRGRGATPAWSQLQSGGSWYMGTARPGGPCRARTCRPVLQPCWHGLRGAAAKHWHGTGAMAVPSRQPSADRHHVLGGAVSGVEPARAGPPADAQPLDSTRPEPTRHAQLVSRRGPGWGGGWGEAREDSAPASSPLPRDGVPAGGSGPLAGQAHAGPAALPAAAPPSAARHGLAAVTKGPGQQHPLACAPSTPNPDCHSHLPAPS